MRVLLVAMSVLASGSAWADQAAKAKPASPLKAVVGAASSASTAKSAAKAPGNAETRGPSKRMVAQQEAMKALAFMDGEWRGASKTLRKQGWASMVQTARVGSTLDGTLRLIEVRSFEADGSIGFEALRILSYDPQKKAYAMRSYQGGAPHNYDVEATSSGIAWTVASGRDVTVRYEMSVANGVWTETATRTAAKRDAAAGNDPSRSGKSAPVRPAKAEPVKIEAAKIEPGKPELFLSVSMKRLRAGGWPSSGALGMK